MSERTETITIKKCPYCDETHTYQLFTKSTVVMLLSDDDNEERVENITCLLSCPTTGKSFQAELEFRRPAKEKIRSLKVQFMSKAN